MNFCALGDQDYFKRWSTEALCILRNNPVPGDYDIHPAQLEISKRRILKHAMPKIVMGQVGTGGTSESRAIKRRRFLNMHDVEK